MDRVYVLPTGPYLDEWRVWPWDDVGKPYVLIEHIREIQSSPYRLPAPLANELYQAGESGMGYILFTLRLKDGREVRCLTGNAVDFPSLPADATTEDIASVTPKTESTGGFSEGPAYRWCLYREPDP